jgi:hypothetical protein
MDQGMTEEEPWHNLTEAARLTGLDREALRSRARRSLVPSRKNNRGELLVQIPAGLLVGADRGNDQASAGELTALRAAVADLSAELAELSERLARSEAELEAQKAVKAAEVSASERTAALYKDQLATERRRADELAAELRYSRRPWFERLIRAIRH